MEKETSGSGVSRRPNRPTRASAIALLLEAHPSLQRSGDEQNVDNLKEIFMDSAETVSGQKTPHDDGYGYGLLRVDKAHQALGG